MFEHPLWQVEWLGNSLQEYTIALLVFVGGLVVLAIIQRVLVKRAERLATRTQTDFDDTVIEIIRTLKPPFYSFVAFYVASRLIEVAGIGRKILDAILIIWVTYQVIKALQISIEYAVRRKLSHEENAQVRGVGNLIRVLTVVVLWVLGALFVLQNLGVNIFSLVAALGIGGLAIGLAAKNIVEDLFSSLAIYIDKPFLPGDLIELGDIKGKVLEVGVRTTTLRALDGEEVIIPNRDIAQSKIKNFGRLTERRVAFDIGVAYETPGEKLKQVPEICEEVVTAQAGVRFERAYVRELAKDKITFQLVYYVEDKSYGAYMDVHEAVLLGLKEKFDQVGVGLA